MATEFLRDCYVDWYRFYRPDLAYTNRQIREQQRTLQHSLQSIQSRLRTRRTKGLLSKRNSIRRTMQTLKQLRGKNAQKRQTILQTLTRRPRKTKSGHTGKAKGKATTKSKGKGTR